MRKGKQKRVLAFLLAMFMVFSTMGNATMTVVASGKTSVDMTTEATKQAEESDAVETETGSDIGAETTGESGEGSVSDVETEEEAGGDSDVAETEEQTGEDSDAAETEEETGEDSDAAETEEPADGDSDAAETEEQTEEVSEEEAESETESDIAAEDETEEDAIVEEVIIENDLVKDLEDEEETEAYYGDVWESEYSASLEINSTNMSTFSDEELLKIINYRKEQELRFDSISVNYPYVEGNPQGSVSKDVWNGLCNLLEDEYGDLSFMFIEEPDNYGYYNICRDWICFAPKQTTDDAVVFDVKWSTGEAGAGVGLTFANTTFPAQDVEMQLYFNPESSACETVRAAFAEGDQPILYLDGQIVKECEIGLNKETGSRVSFTIKDINDLTQAVTYVLNAKGYTGTVSTDVNGGKYSLSIDHAKDDGTLYSDDELLEMLQWNLDTYGTSFTTLEFVDILEPETSSRVISGKVANAARSIMTAETTGISGHTIRYWTRSSDSSNIFDIYMGKPEENFAPDGDATVSYTLDVSETEAKFSFEAPDYKVVQLQMRVFFEKGSEKANALENLFGENTHRYDLWIGDQGISYDSDSNGVMLTFLDVADLERGKEYTIKDTQEETVEDAPGTITNNYGTRELKVSADEIGLDNWERGSLKTNLKAYKDLIDAGKMERFNSITIVQKEQDNNVIYKEDYNFLLGLLKSNAYTTLYFDFDGAWNGGLTKETIWQFTNPTKASADIVANVSYAEAESGGAIQMQIASNSYPAQNASVRCHTDRTSDLGILFDRIFGEVTSDQNNKKVAVATSLGNVKEVYPAYSMYSLDGSQETAENADLSVGGLKNYSTKEFYLLPVNEYKETFAIGKTGGYQLESAKTPDGDVTWQCYASYYATVSEDGLLTPIRESDVYLFWAAYQSEGKPVMEVYQGVIERRVADMRFKNGSLEKPLEMELPPSAEENAEAVTECLYWISYPTGTQITSDELQWSAEGDAVELVTDDSGNCIGKIKAVSEGEAIVTATYTEDPSVTASVKVIVKPSIWDEINSANVDIIAVSGIHKTLKELEDQLPDGFAWATPSMSLSGFTSELEVPAVYTAEDGRTAACDIKVCILAFDNIDIKVCSSGLDVVENGGAIVGGETIYFDNLVKMSSYGSMSLDEFNENASYGSKYRLSIVPDAKTKKLVKESDNEEAGQYMFVSDPASAGKKVFSFEMHLSDVKGNALGVVAKAGVTITVAKKALMNWNSATISRQVAGESLESLITLASSDEKGQLVILQPSDAYFKITARSLDSAVCKITKTTTDSENYPGQIATCIDYEVKKGGRVYIQLTAADEVKSEKLITFTAEDIMPKPEQSTVTIDKAREDVSASVKWQLYEGTAIGEGDTVLTYTINGKESTDFTVSVVKTENLKAEVKVTLKNPEIKKGKYKLKLQVPVIYSGETYATPFETEIVVSVTDTKPVATVKQSKKVNLLYKNNAEPGTFIIEPKGDWTISDITLENQSDKKKCDYELQISDNVIRVVLKEGGNPKNTKGKLVITTNEYAGKTFVKNVTIATENKKPAIVLSKKTETLYPYFNLSEGAKSTIEVINKATGTALTTYELQVKEGKKWVTLEADADHSYKSNKNNYTINHKDGVLNLTLNSAVKATDKFNFRVRQTDWNDNNYVELSYSIKVDTAYPKLVLSASTLTLNKNEDIYESQIAKAKLTLKGGDNQFDETYKVSFEGINASAENVKNKYLNFSFADGEIYVAFNDSDKDLVQGKYKYMVSLRNENTRTLYTYITINIVDVTPQKCLTVKGKGTIDILNREDTAVTYTVKASNLQGKLVACQLAGPDKNKFYVSGVNDGKVVVKAAAQATFSTKVTYKVTPVLIFENEEGVRYCISTSTQNIKVKQGKPKVTVTTADGAQNILYRDRDNKIDLDFNAVLGKKEVQISRVELVNYTSDLEVSCNLDSETGELENVTLTQSAAKQILASGKTWKVKFKVYFTDGAGTEKATQVTYKLIVK